MDSHLNEDGTRSFLVDTLDKDGAITALSKFNIEVIDAEGAIFDGSGRVLEVDFTVRGSEGDISFALDSMIKMIRPYPKSFVHKRRG